VWTMRDKNIIFKNMRTAMALFFDYKNPNNIILRPKNYKK